MTLRSSDGAGFGFDIYGDESGAIAVQSLQSGGPAAQSGVLQPGQSVCHSSLVLPSSLFVSTLCLKKACDYIFCNNLDNECPIIIIFGTLINETICHRMVVSFPTSSI